MNNGKEKALDIGQKFLFIFMQIFSSITVARVNPQSPLVIEFLLFSSKREMFAASQNKNDVSLQLLFFFGFTHLISPKTLKVENCLVQFASDDRN